MTALWLVLTLLWAVAEARRAPQWTSTGGEASWLPAVTGLTLLGITAWGLLHRDGSAWGAPLLAGGAWLRITALDALGERFRHHVELLPGHRLETSGPYAYVRHPSELGLLAIGAGTGVLLGTPLAGLALLPLAWLRMRAEDRLLAAAFGPSWTAWAARTPALLPLHRLGVASMLTISLSHTALAATLTVGPGETYERVADAINGSSPGDEILIQSGEYVDDTVSFPHGDLTILGIGDTRPILLVTENIPNRKGIFAIPVGAGPVTVENLHFEGARVSDSDGANGAGIRMQGQALTVRECTFTNNQMGLLAGGTDDFTVWVENSEFDSNAQEGSGYEHNIYIGTDQCAEFTFIGNYSHHAHSGHQLKSRCQVNHILYNRLMDEAEGSSSYIIDLPEGGRSIVVGNLVQQGPNAENSSAIISYAAESTNDEMVLYAAHNTIVNDKDTTTTSFIRASIATTVVLRNNLFIGKGTPLEVDDSAAEVDDQGSLHLELGEVLLDRDAYDYHLVEGTLPQDAGVQVDEIDGEYLTPTLQYLHPTSTEPRWDDGAPDIGAYGIGSAPQDTGPSSADTGDSATPEQVEPADCSCGSRRRSPPIGLVMLVGLLVGGRRRSGA